MKKNSQQNHAKPFLKWAGGKGQLLSEFERFYPQSLKEGTLKHYCEPFLGSGAVFFHLAQNYPLQKFTLCDINSDLILTYKTVRNQLGPLIEVLKNMQSKYWQYEAERKKSYYYNMRLAFNKKANLPLSKLSLEETIQRAAQVIFLNRTCYNGLFRLNNKGEFNTPAGSYTKPKICDEPNLLAASSVLKKAAIKKQDFKTALKNPKPGTFVYLDPPYRPISKTASFTSYSKVSFTDQDQKDLAKACIELNKRKILFMLSNSDPKNHNASDDFFDQLYAHPSFDITRIPAKRLINSKAQKRGAIHELLIKNYKT